MPPQNSEHSFHGIKPPFHMHTDNAPKYHRVTKYHRVITCVHTHTSVACLPLHANMHEPLPLALSGVSFPKPPGSAPPPSSSWPLICTCTYFRTRVRMSLGENVPR
eukprot:KAF5829290.1 hypothetical protein DUNSADRAFT_16288 [Dunaliella salina]